MNQLGLDDCLSPRRQHNSRAIELSERVGAGDAIVGELEQPLLGLSDTQFTELTGVSQMGLSSVNWLPCQLLGLYQASQRLERP
ncbi:hypothetical protein C7271_15485 [filamentous cyanobacterium CCP5]|nr:hypothetical protein C7293_31025 [filamentous cyanobacterium CCT1]PSN17864.1 hypothetical protein C7271_15485 [filamentous cyanobacterium CCP5]